MADPPVGDASVAAALARAVAADHARVMAAVIATVVDWQVAEDAVQDACERALTAWAREGVPANPAGWLVTTARRRGIDLLRRAGGRRATLQRYGVAVGRGLLEPAAPGETDGTGDHVGDDRLRLVLTCAHPVLPLASRVALTLRTVLGWTPDEIARAFLVSEAAVAKRLVRARAALASSGVPYRVPGPAELPERVDGVLAVVYLVFTEGYVDPVGRGALAPEAVRLARLVRDLLDPARPERLEASGLLALLLAQHARHGARVGPDGGTVPLDRQDRSLWDRAALSEAEGIVAGVLQHAAHRRRPVGRYTLQAAIALEHGRPSTAQETDWVRIARLHELLNRLDDVPAQRIAWAVAVGRAEGPERGLAVLDGVRRGERLHLLHAARGDLLEAAGRCDEAAAAYARAAELAPGQVEGRVLRARSEGLARGPVTGGPGAA